MHDNNLDSDTLTFLTAKKQPMSYQEANLAYLMDKHPDNPTNHLSKAVQITGDINKNALEVSINKIIELNPNLRAFFKFSEKNKKFQKYILPYNPQDTKIEYIKYIDARNNTKQEQKTILNDLLAKPYKINQYPLIGTYIIKTDEKSSTLILSMSHLIGDGYSAYLIFGLIECIYNFITNPLPYTNRRSIDILLFGLTETLYYYLIKPLAQRISPNYQTWANQNLANLYCSTIQTITNNKLLAYSQMCQRQINYIQNSDHPAYQYFGRITQYAEFNPKQKLKDNNNINKTHIHLFTTEIPELEKKIIKALSKRYKAQTPRILIALYHLTLYYYAQKSCAVRTLNYHRRKSEIYSVGYFAQDMISFCGNLLPNHNFQQIVSGVKDHFLIQKTLDKQGLRPAQIPASLCFNKDNSPLQTEFNYIQGLSFKLKLNYLDTKSDNNLQDESILQTWQAPINNIYGYNIELSMYINNSQDKMTVQIMSAKHAYPESFATEFHKTYLDNIKRVWALNNTPLNALCQTDISSLPTLDSLETQEQESNSLISTITSHPVMTACTIFAIIGVAHSMNINPKNYFNFE